MRTKTLFVCARNRWRSPTAERVFQDDMRLEPRSRGVSDRAVRPLQAADVAWADVIFVMEFKQRERILARFREAVGEKPICVLDIPDDYAFMDAELVELLRAGVEAFLGDERAE